GGAGDPERRVPRPPEKRAVGQDLALIARHQHDSASRPVVRQKSRPHRVIGLPCWSAADGRNRLQILAEKLRDLHRPMLFREPDVGPPSEVPPILVCLEASATTT